MLLLTSRSLQDEKGVLVKLWTIDAVELCAFDTLIRRAGEKAVVRQFDLLLPILQSHLTGILSEKNDLPICEVKLFFMFTVESIITNSQCSTHCLLPLIEYLFENLFSIVLSPQNVTIENSLKKVSLALVYSILKSYRESIESILYQFAPVFLQELRKTLVDGDTTTRELSCLILGLLFNIIPISFGKDSIINFYPDLISCLDDNVEIFDFVDAIL